jgi:hypothetical protein
MNLLKGEAGYADVMELASRFPLYSGRVAAAQA